jgi:16S rRNA (guanine1516-N2)-methyltransferase
MSRADKTPEPHSLICDFTGGAVEHRFRFGGGRGQALPKAVGMKDGKTPKVVDATAGLGRDAFLLASLGAQVTLIERSPEMHKLLKEGMARAGQAGGDIAEVIARMTLLHGDARALLPTLSPEVVLVDPMHPPRKKSALVKNEMRLIREIVGTDEDAIDLMKVALATARKRVVLKWPQRADPMAGIGPPSHRITGKSTRYDVFMVG